MSRIGRFIEKESRLVATYWEEECKVTTDEFLCVCAEGELM